LWGDHGLGRDQLLDFGGLKTLIQAEYRFTDTVSLAAIGAGVDAGVLREADKRVGLGSRQVPSFWRVVLDKAESEPHDGLLPPVVRAALTVEHDLTEETADHAIDAGIECGVLYGDRDTGPLRVNTPRDEEGPDIDDAAFDVETYYPDDVAIDSSLSDDDPDSDAGQPHSDPSVQSSGQPSGNLSGDLSGHLSDEESTEISSQESLRESRETPDETADATSREESERVSNESSTEKSRQESTPKSDGLSTETSTGVSGEVADEIPDEIASQEPVEVSDAASTSDAEAGPADDAAPDGGPPRGPW